jgi:chromosome segregation ATPase
MSEIPEYTTDKGGSSWQMPAIAILALIALGGLFFGWSNSAKLDAARQAVTDQVKTVQQATQQDLGAMKERLAVDEKSNADLQGDLKVVTDKLKITQGQLKKARTEAAQLNSETANKVAALDTSVHTELATKATNDDVKTVDTKVSTVSDNLAKTNNDLTMARSELGTLIARNHDEIDVLRRMGERDYIEFTIAGKNKPQKVGNLTVELKGVNEKHNRANVVVVLEDKRLEEKNRNINSPIIIYPSGAHQAQEVVINKIGKNSISGYLSVPKAGVQPSSASSKSGN